MVNQGTIRSGPEGDEILGRTDDPTTPAAPDATVFRVAPFYPELSGEKTVVGTPETFRSAAR